MDAWAGVKTEAALRQLALSEVELSQRSQKGIARCRSGDDVCKAVEPYVLAGLAAECDDVSRGCATPLGKTDAE